MPATRHTAPSEVRMSPHLLILSPTHAFMWRVFTGHLLGPGCCSRPGRHSLGPNRREPGELTSYGNRQSNEEMSETEHIGGCSVLWESLVAFLGKWSGRPHSQIRKDLERVKEQPMQMSWGKSPRRREQPGKSRKDPWLFNCGQPCFIYLQVEETRLCALP